MFLKKDIPDKPRGEGNTLNQCNIDSRDLEKKIAFYSISKVKESL